MGTIQELYDEFTLKYNSLNKLLSDSTVLYQNNVQHSGIFYSKEMYSAIVEYCFMQLFLAWETFLEQSFIFYLSDAKDLKGNNYTRYGFPKDTIHAYNMIKGTKNYPDWTSLNDVICLAKIYFLSAGPYQWITSNPVDMGDIKTIRNRISHVSEKSIKAFNRLLAKTIIRTTNVSVSDFLMSFRQGNETYYTYYTDLIKSYVEAICNK